LIIETIFIIFIDNQRTMAGFDFDLLRPLLPWPISRFPGAAERLNLTQSGRWSQQIKAA